MISYANMRNILLEKMERNTEFTLQELCDELNGIKTSLSKKLQLLSCQEPFVGVIKQKWVGRQKVFYFNN